MVGATVYPQAMSNAAGRADHGIAALMFWAMSAGFVRGVGFLPRFWLWRWLFRAGPARSRWPWLCDCAWRAELRWREAAAAQPKTTCTGRIGAITDGRPDREIRQKEVREPWEVVRSGRRGRLIRH